MKLRRILFLALFALVLFLPQIASAEDECYGVWGERAVQIEGGDYVCGSFGLVCYWCCSCVGTGIDRVCYCEAG